MKHELDEEQGILVRKSTEIMALLVRVGEGGKEMGPFQRSMFRSWNRWFLIVEWRF